MESNTFWSRLTAKCFKRYLVIYERANHSLRYSLIASLPVEQVGECKRSSGWLVVGRYVYSSKRRMYVTENTYQIDFSKQQSKQKKRDKRNQYLTSLLGFVRDVLP